METATARDRWTKFTKCFCQGARLMVGVPDYDIYVYTWAVLIPTDRS